MNLRKNSDIVVMLMSSALFRGFTKAEIMAAIPALEPFLKDYVKNDIAIRENTEAYLLALVVSGRFKAMKLANEGGKHIITLHDPGDLLGLEACKSSPATWPRTYTCEEDGKLLWFNISELISDISSIYAVRSNMRLRDNMERILSDIVVKLHYRVDVLATSPLEDRIMAYLKFMRDKRDSNTLDIKMNRTQFASYLAVDRSTLSRELRKMKQAGLIETNGESGIILKTE